MTSPLPNKPKKSCWDVPSCNLLLTTSSASTCTPLNARVPRWRLHRRRFKGVSKRFWFFCKVWEREGTRPRVPTCLPVRHPLVLLIRPDLLGGSLHLQQHLHPHQGHRRHLGDSGHHSFPKETWGYRSPCPTEPTWRTAPPGHLLFFLKSTGPAGTEPAFFASKVDGLGVPRS